MSNHELHKYYSKHETWMSKLIGGAVIKPDWLDIFLEELNQVYEADYVITGSGAIVLYLNYFNHLTNGKFNDLISSIRVPNDIDFLYYCKGTDYESRRTIGKFSRLQDSPQRSVTYGFSSQDALPNIIKSFDLTCGSKISYVLIDKYKVLSLDKLLDFYSGELEDDEMIFNSNKTKLLELEKYIEDSKKKRKISEFLDSESEHGDLEIVLDKIKNKLLALETKINIVSVLKSNIKIEPDIESIYELKYIPETTSTPQSTSQSTSRNLFSSNTIRKLLDSDYEEEMDSVPKPKFSDSDSGYESENDTSDEIKPRELFSSFEETPKKKPMLPIIDLHTSTPVSAPVSAPVSTQPRLAPIQAAHTTSKDLTIDSSRTDASTIKYVHLPYTIKFDFEKEP
jgi:hypothetical protein